MCSSELSCSCSGVVVEIQAQPPMRYIEIVEIRKLRPRRRRSKIRRVTRVSTLAMLVWYYFVGLFLYYFQSSKGDVLCM